jgi:CheY-like chemotaxis protein
MKRVLVVDDDAHIRRLARHVLISAGFEVLLAADGREALEIVADSHPAVVVLDVSMPVMDGREMFAKMKSLDERPCALIISAFEVERVRREIGAEDCLAKPFAPEDLVQKVNNLIDGVAA